MAKPAARARIEQAWWLTLGRAPSASEVRRAQRFLTEYRGVWSKLPVESPAEAPVVTAVAAKATEIAGFTLQDDPDNVDRTEYVAPEEAVQPANDESAAWMSLVQVLYASAEFRFVR